MNVKLKDTKVTLLKNNVFIQYHEDINRSIIFTELR